MLFNHAEKKRERKRIGIITRYAVIVNLFTWELRSWSTKIILTFSDKFTAFVKLISNNFTDDTSKFYDPKKHALRWLLIIFRSMAVHSTVFPETPLREQICVTPTSWMRAAVHSEENFDQSTRMIGRKLGRKIRCRRATSYSEENLSSISMHSVYSLHALREQICYYETTVYYIHVWTCDNALETTWYLYYFNANLVSQTLTQNK